MKIKTALHQRERKTYCLSLSAGLFVPSPGILPHECRPPGQSQMCSALGGVCRYRQMVIKCGSTPLVPCFEIAEVRIKQGSRGGVFSPQGVIRINGVRIKQSGLY